MTEGAVKMAASRRLENATARSSAGDRRTVADPADVEDEVRATVRRPAPR